MTSDAEMIYSYIDTIQVGPGPEDMLLDTSSGTARLIISCGDYRKTMNNDRVGSIWYYDIIKNISSQFKIIGLPANFPFFPHGISSIQNEKGVRLYVINHGSNDRKQNDNSVLIFSLHNNMLIFEDSIRDKQALTTPNDLTVCPDGSFYITNEGGFSLGDFLLRLIIRKSNVMYYDSKSKTFRKTSVGALMANGIYQKGDTLYVTDSMKKHFLKYKINEDKTLTLLTKIKIANHLDNISPSVDNKKLFIPSHDSVCKLQAHKKNPKKQSPFTVYETDLNTNISKKVFSDDGSLINAVSTALVYEGDLYLSQIFENFIIRLKLK